MTLVSKVKVKIIKCHQFGTKHSIFLHRLKDVVHIWHTDCLWCLDDKEGFGSLVCLLSQRSGGILTLGTDVSSALSISISRCLDVGYLNGFLGRQVSKWGFGQTAKIQICAQDGC